MAFCFKLRDWNVGQDEKRILVAEIHTEDRRDLFTEYRK